MRVVLDHRRNMGSSIWGNICGCFAHVAAEDLGGNGKSPLGIVEHGKPVPTNRIAGDLETVSRDATLTNLRLISSRCAALNPHPQPRISRASARPLLLCLALLRTQYACVFDTLRCTTP